jgi:endo-1,4-beta-xylanase
MTFSKKRMSYLAGCLTALAVITSCTQVGSPNRRPVTGQKPATPSKATPGKAQSEVGSYLAKSDEISFELSAVNPDAATAGIQAVKGQAFQQALQAKYTQDDHGPWMAVLKTTDTQAIPMHTAVIATFHARSAPPYNSDRDAVVGFYVYREDPWRQLTANRIVVDDQWREYSVIFTLDESYQAGELSVAFDVGQKKQTVEIGNIRLRDLAIEPEADKAATSSTYAGRSANAGWRKDAAKRIEDIRKGPMSIKVVDTSGKPAQATVSYTLKKHAFGLGTAVNKRLVAHQDTPDHQRYAKQVTGLFNKAVLENGMKWNQWESSYAPFLKEDTLKAVDWLTENHIAIRGTALVWPGWDKQNPAGLKDLKPAELQKRIDDHLRDLVGTFKGRVSEWDVVNESRTNKDFTRALGANAIPGWFKLAGSIDPAARLYLNDFGILNGSDTAIGQLEETVKAIQKAGAPIHGIGLQSHFDSYLPSPERMQEILDRLGKLGLDIQATEFDVNLSDESTQADFTRDFVTVLFSHPNVTGITLWGFWEGQHWKPDCALFRQDWSIKPNGQVLLDLFNKEWTSAGKLAGGTANAFYGDYEVQVTHAGKTSTHTISHRTNVKEHIIDLRKAGTVQTIAGPSAPKPAVKPEPPKGVPPFVAPKVVTPDPVKKPTPSVVPPVIVTPSPVVPPKAVVPAPVPPKVVKPAVPVTPPVVEQPEPVKKPQLVQPAPQPKPPSVTPKSTPSPTFPRPKAPAPVRPVTKPEGPNVPEVKPPSVIPPKPEVRAPSITPPKPSATGQRPSVTLPRPGVKAPSVTLPKPSVTLPKPSVTLPKPSVTLPAPTQSKQVPIKPNAPTVTLPKPSVTLPKPSVKPPVINTPVVPPTAIPAVKAPVGAPAPGPVKTLLPKPAINPPAANQPIPKVTPPKVALPVVRPPSPASAIKPAPAPVPPAPSPVTPPPSSPEATKPAATSSQAAEAQDRMTSLKDRLRKARERMQEKSAEQK